MLDKSHTTMSHTYVNSEARTANKMFAQWWGDV